MAVRVCCVGVRPCGTEQHNCILTPISSSDRVCSRIDLRVPDAACVLSLTERAQYVAARRAAVGGLRSAHAVTVGGQVPLELCALQCTTVVCGHVCLAAAAGEPYCSSGGCIRSPHCDVERRCSQRVA